MADTAPIVVIGTGLAGYHLVKELRKLAPEQAVVMISADDGRNYSKPMLSTGFGKNKSADELAMATAADMAAQLNIVVRTHTRVTAIDTKAQQVFIGDETVPYSKLVMAVGANVITPAIEGDGQDLVFSINDLEDYAKFRAAAAGKQRVLIMGAGLIGCEYANDMHEGGFSIDLVDPSNQVLPTLLPVGAAHALQLGLESLGVRLHLGTVVQRLERTADGLKAILNNGTELITDLVVSAIGLRPRLDLAQAAGLATGRGIQVNRFLETSAANVYALGDCAEVEGKVLPFVLPLMAAARALAKNLAGESTAVSYGVMPVTIKTPVVPIVVSPPAPNSEGGWQEDRDNVHVHAEFRHQNGQLLGYALTGDKVVNKVALNKELPAILP